MANVRKESNSKSKQNTDDHTVHATKEIILSAGAIDTPKILMLSGIGDKSELESHGITSLIHLPGVGKNLSVHFSTVALTQRIHN